MPIYPFTTANGYERRLLATAVQAMAVGTHDPEWLSVQQQLYATVAVDLFDEASDKEVDLRLNEQQCSWLEIGVRQALEDGVFAQEERVAPNGATATATAQRLLKELEPS